MVTWPGSRRNRRRRTNSLLLSSNRVSPNLSSSTLNHSISKRSAIHGRKTASTCPESEARTLSTMSSGTMGGLFGGGVSERGPRFLSPMALDLDAPSRGFTPAVLTQLVTETGAGGGKEVGNPYHGGVGGRDAKAPIWACRSVGRSLPWHGRGPEFKSRHVHHSIEFQLCFFWHERHIDRSEPLGVRSPYEGRLQTSQR